MLAAAVASTAILVLILAYVVGRLALYWLARKAFGRAGDW